VTHVGPSHPANEPQSLTRLPPAILVAMLEAARETADAVCLEAEENHKCLIEMNKDLVQENLKLHQSLEAMEHAIQTIHDISGSAISGEGDAKIE
jgi:hypothetical protein